MAEEGLLNDGNGAGAWCVEMRRQWADEVSDSNKKDIRSDEGTKMQYDYAASDPHKQD